MRPDNYDAHCEVSVGGGGEVVRHYLPGLGSLGVTGGLSGLRRRRPNSRTDGSRAGGFSYPFVGTRQAAQAQTAPTGRLYWVHITQSVLAQGVCAHLHTCTCTRAVYRGGRLQLLPHSDNKPHVGQRTVCFAQWVNGGISHIHPRPGYTRPTDQNVHIFICTYSYSLGVQSRVPLKIIWGNFYSVKYTN